MLFQKLMIVSVAALALLLAGCPRNDEPIEDNEVAQVVEMTEYRFSPQEVTIRQGESVRWQNAGEEAHTVTADPARAEDSANVELPEGAQPFHSGTIEPGGTFTHTFDIPGTYRYVCAPHEDENMVGVVIVEPAEENDAENDDVARADEEAAPQDGEAEAQDDGAAPQN